jgi:hypothetical protein
MLLIVQFDVMGQSLGTLGSQNTKSFGPLHVMRHCTST